MSEWSGLRVGYVPYASDLSAPGDRRRIVSWARARDVELVLAEPGGRYDLVVLSARADITRWRDEPRGTPLVYDLIDSYLALPRWSPRSLLRGPAKFAARETSRLSLDYRRSIEAMCRRADAVVCTTTEQRAACGALNDNVHVVLDAHDELDAPPKDDFAIGPVLNLVWEGLPHTLGPLRALRPVLADLAGDRPVHLHLVTDPEFHEYAGRFRRRSTARLAEEIHPQAFVHAWHPSVMPAIVTACDIAVIPLDLDDPFSRGKPENKLLILWRLGMPTVTSASPAYERAMAGAGLDLSCTTPDDWRRTLSGLAGDEAARADASAKGLAYVARHHSREQLLAAWDDVVRSVVGGPAR